MTFQRHPWTPPSTSQGTLQHPQRVQKRTMLFLLGILAFSQFSTSLGWSPLFRPSHRLKPAVSSSSRRQGRSRLWMAQQQHNVGSNNSSVETITTKDLQTPTNMEYDLLEEENGFLRETIRQLELENERLRKSASRIVIENFEGERRLSSESSWFEGMTNTEEGITMTEEEMEAPQMWCDELEEDVCPVEPTISFGTSYLNCHVVVLVVYIIISDPNDTAGEALRDRAYWLVGLLAMQSCSGFILAQNELLLEKHPVIIYFLTMLVGAGGNAGNQASVRGTCCINITAVFSLVENPSHRMLHDYYSHSRTCVGNVE